MGLDDHLPPVYRQAIIWTNPDLSIMTTFTTNFSEILKEVQTFFIEENTFQITMSKMAALFFPRSQCAKYSQPRHLLISCFIDEYVFQMQEIYYTPACKATKSN